MKKKGDVYNNIPYGYWEIVEVKGNMCLMQATNFSGRPKRCHEIHKEEGKHCPFNKCDYESNQFCLSKEFFIGKLVEGREFFMYHLKHKGNNYYLPRMRKFWKKKGIKE